jgi:hypothetical protein
MSQSTATKKKVRFSSRVISNVRGNHLTEIYNGNHNQKLNQETNQITKNEIQSRTKVWKEYKPHTKISKRLLESNNLGNLHGQNQLPSGHFNLVQLQQNTKAKKLAHKYLENLEKLDKLKNRKEQIVQILEKKNNINISSIAANTHSTTPIIMKYTQVLKDEEKLENIILIIDQQLTKLGVNTQELYGYYLEHRKKLHTHRKKKNNSNNVNTVNNFNNNNYNRGPTLAEIEAAQQQFKSSQK